MKTKKGIMSPFAISLIILIISFVVILLFYSLVFKNYQSNVNKDVCRASVQARSTFTWGPLNPGQRFVSLKCKTEKICLTEFPSKTCENQFGVSSKDNPVTIIKLSDDSQEAKQQIIQTYGNALYDCNYMMGEGKQNFLPDVTFTETYCAICSRIALDNSTENPAQKGINYFDVYWYMENKKDSTGRSYLEAVFNQKHATDIKNDLLGAIAKLNLEGKISNGEIAELKNLGVQSLDLNTDDWVFNASDEQAIMIKAVTSGTWGAKLAGGGVFGAITAGGIWLSTTVVGAWIGVPLTIIGGMGLATGVSGVVYISTFPDGNGQYFTPQIYSYNAASIGKERCQSFENLP